MDPFTHAASGALLALSCSHKPATRFFVPLAAFVAASPDLDVIVAPLPLDFLLLHRGITHSLPAVPVMALLLAWCLFPLWRGHNPHSELVDMRNVAGTFVFPTWSFKKTYGFTVLLLLLHIWLDCVTSYGTMIFLPFSDYRVRLNGVFIVDIFLVIPMLVALVRGCKWRQWAIVGLIWIVVYPSACVGLRVWHEHVAQKQLALNGIHATQLTVLPDAFAPLYWRLIYQVDQPFSPEEVEHFIHKASRIDGFQMPRASQTVYEQGLNVFGAAYTQAIPYPALEKDASISLRQVSVDANAFLDFTLMPVQQVRVAPEAVDENEVNEETQTNEDTSGALAIYDVRFGSMLPFVQKIMHMRNKGIPPFVFYAQHEDSRWTKVRLSFMGASKESPWHAPVPPRSAVPWWQWIVGIQL